MCENKDCSLANLKEARGERNFSTAVSTPPTLLHSSPHGPSLPPRTSSGLVLAVACQKVSIDAFCCAEAPAFNLSSFLVRTLLGTRVSFCSMMGYKYIVLPCWFIFKTSKRPSSFLQEIALLPILIQNLPRQRLAIRQNLVSSQSCSHPHVDSSLVLADTTFRTRRCFLLSVDHETPPGLSFATNMLVNRQRTSLIHKWLRACGDGATENTRKEKRVVIAVGSHSHRPCGPDVPTGHVFPTVHDVPTGWSTSREIYHTQILAA